MVDLPFIIAIYSLIFAVIVSLDASRFSASMKEIVDFFIENEDALIEKGKYTSLIKAYERNQTLFIFSIFKSNIRVVYFLVASLFGSLLLSMVDEQYSLNIWGFLLSIIGFALLLSPIIYMIVVIYFAPVKDGIWVSFDDAVKRRKIELNEDS